MDKITELKELRRLQQVGDVDDDWRYRNAAADAVPDLLDRIAQQQAEIGRLQKLLNSWLALTHITPINQYSLDLRSETERALKGGAG